MIVDGLAKNALIAGVGEQEFISSKFPFERLLVELDGVKVTGAPRMAFERHWGAKIARKLYHEKHMINKYEFNLVWWDGVDKTMYDFPRMFRVFVTTQRSKFCGMNCRLSCFDDSAENVCPSCGKEDESLKNITRCRDPG